jgi:hypothetical protein
VVTRDPDDLGRLDCGDLSRRARGQGEARPTRLRLLDEQQFEMLAERSSTARTSPFRPP